MTEFSGVSLPWLYLKIEDLAKIAKGSALVKFFAARTIQKYVRGWLVRKYFAERNRAAIIIQKTWRAFLGRRKYYEYLQSLVDIEARKYYEKMAIRIQTLFRGYWSRKHIHDHYKLKNYQHLAAEDLIKCIAFKLHHMLRTYQIPGVYSIRNSKCLSKIEQLLTTIRFKQYNDAIRAQRLQAEKDFNNLKEQSKVNLDQTKIPYGSLCERTWNQPNAEQKMHEMLKNYVAPKPVVGKPKPEEGFCADIVKSLHKWNIVDDEHNLINPNVVKNPRNVEGFVDEIQSVCEVRGIHQSCVPKQFKKK